MQCKDIDMRPILEFAVHQTDVMDRWSFYFGSLSLEECPNNIAFAFPEGTPEKLARAKLRKLVKSGYLSGCTCGCRGDFHITDKGRAFLKGEPFVPAPKEKVIGFIGTDSWLVKGVDGSARILTLVPVKGDE